MSKPSIRLTMKRLGELREAYRDHRHHAERRGIAFEISFKDWLRAWNDSGHLHERGRRRGEYCMARIADRGPYRIGNIVIMLSSQNVAEGNRGKKRSAETRRKIALARIGKSLSAESRAKLSLARRGKPGHPRTRATRAKIGRAVRLRWNEWRLAHQVEARL